MVSRVTPLTTDLLGAREGMCRECCVRTRRGRRRRRRRQRGRARRRKRSGPLCISSILFTCV